MIADTESDCRHRVWLSRHRRVFMFMFMENEICGWRQKKTPLNSQQNSSYFGPYKSENSINSNSWTSSNFWFCLSGPQYFSTQTESLDCCVESCSTLPTLPYHYTVIQLYSYTVTRLPSTWALQPTCLSAASTAHTRQPEYKEGQHTIAACQILINTLDTSLKTTQFSIKYDDRAHLSG